MRWAVCKWHTRVDRVSCVNHLALQSDPCCIVTTTHTMRRSVDKQADVSGVHTAIEAWFII